MLGSRQRLKLIVISGLHQTSTPTMAMELSVSVTLGFRSHSHSPSEEDPLNHFHLIPVSIKPKKPNTTLTVRAKKKSTIEGVSDELNAIASQNLDFAPSRRRVRAAFTDVQQQLDHYLFKVTSHTSSYSILYAMHSFHCCCSIISFRLSLIFPFFLFTGCAFGIV